MRTYDRLLALQKFTYERICKGRKMKRPAKDMNVKVIERCEPQVFLAWFPTRPDENGFSAESALTSAPSILIMPTQGYGKYVEVFRKNTEYNIHRPQSMGHSLNVQVLFTVYEDGVRYPGFIDSKGKYDMSLIKEGTQDGLRTLLNWMDEFMEAVLGQKVLPGTDMAVTEATVTYSPYLAGEYVADKRPIFYGVVDVGFACHADEVPNKEISDLID